MNSLFSRRSFLQAAGVGGGMLPLLEAEPARGATASGGPKRMVVICWTGGIRRGDTWPILGPSGSETDWRLPTKGEGPTSSPFNEPVLEPVVSKFRNDMVLISALDLEVYLDMKMRYGVSKISGGDTGISGGHHDLPTLLTGRSITQFNGDNYVAVAGGPSIDRVIGDEMVKRYGVPFNTLTVGGRTGSGYQSTMSYMGRGDSQGVTPENDPTSLYKKLFAGRTLGGDGIDRALLARKSVVEYLSKDLERFGKRIGSADRLRIDAHLQGVREVEQQLSARGTGVSCTAPAAPAGAKAFEGAANYPALVRTQSDLLFMALRCDLTRTATLMLTNSGGNDLTFPWLGNEFTQAADDWPDDGIGKPEIRMWHEMAHAEFMGTDKGTRHSLVSRWFWEQVAYFVGRLKETPEGTGSMLDNTVVVVLNMFGLNHMVRGLPAILFGGCGGAIKTGGRLLRFGDYASGKYKYFWGDADQTLANTGPKMASVGVPHNQLLTALSNAMDVPTEGVGEVEYKGILPGLLA